MTALPRLLAPAPAALTVERLSIAATVAVTAAGAPVVVGAIRELRQVVRHMATATAVTTLVACALAAVVARRALASRSVLHARMVCLVGGAVAGMVAALASYVAIVVLGAGDRIPYRSELAGLVLGGFVLGAPIGAAFGTAFAPVLVAARQALLAPTHDGLDRVAGAAGASLMMAGASGALLPGRFPAVYGAIVAAGALIAAIAAARLVARARLLLRVVASDAEGFSIEPPSDAEDERALVPFVRSTIASTGVLLMTGVSAPYRGTRGAVRIARAPLPGEPLDPPLAGIAAGVIDELGAALLCVPIALAGIGAVGIAIGVLALMMSASR